MIAVWEQGIQRWLQRDSKNVMGINPQQVIDFGNGATLGPEDVLETHFQRLARRRLSARRPVRGSAIADPVLRRWAERGERQSTGPRTVPVQVGDNLVAAITVLAPQLAPLTELAEDVAAQVAPVQPEQAFRTSLHHALEQTHRRHAAQRTLGMRPKTSIERGLAWLWLIPVGIATCILLVGVWAMRRRLTA